MDDSESDVDGFCAHPDSDVDVDESDVDDSESDVDDFRTHAGSDSDVDGFCDPNSYADDFYAFYGCRPLRSGAVVLRHPRAELFRE